MAHNDARHKKAQRCVNARCSSRRLRSLKPTPRSQLATKGWGEEGQEERDPLEWNHKTGVRKERQADHRQKEETGVPEERRVRKKRQAGVRREQVKLRVTEPRYLKIL